MSGGEAKHGGWPRAAASAAIFRGRSILLVERGKGAPRGTWALPGGHIEPGETAAAAAAREVQEETGLSVAIRGLVDVRDVIIHAETGELAAHYVLAVYHGFTTSEDEPHAQSDALSARFVPFDELAGLRLTPGVGQAIDLARRLAGL